MSCSTASWVVVFLVYAAALLLSPPVARAGEDPFKSRYARYCFNCHAIDPASLSPPRYPPPKIAGQDARYLARALEEYREGKRNQFLMNSPAEMLAPDIIDTLVAHIAALDGSDLPRYPAAAVDDALVHTGMALAAKYCNSCHPPDIARSKPGTPILNGQYQAYLESVMADYRLGVRTSREMNEAMAPLSTDEMRAIAAYYASLGGLYP